MYCHACVCARTCLRASVCTSAYMCVRVCTFVNACARACGKERRKDKHQTKSFLKTVAEFQLENSMYLIDKVASQQLRVGQNRAVSDDGHPDLVRVR